MIGNYRVTRRLGEGGMGTVYELLHDQIGKRLALKVLHRRYAEERHIVRRFFDEARAVNLIGHPNIVDIIDCNHLASGSPYLTMEYLGGQSLATFLAESEALSLAKVAQLCLPLCSALGAAHAAGIIHRDLKPDNIHLVGPPVFVKVLDFGIAKLQDDTPDANSASLVLCSVHRAICRPNKEWAGSIKWIIGLTYTRSALSSTRCLREKRLFQPPALATSYSNTCRSPLLPSLGAYPSHGTKSRRLLSPKNASTVFNPWKNFPARSTPRFAAKRSSPAPPFPDLAPPKPSIAAPSADTNNQSTASPAVAIQQRPPPPVPLQTKPLGSSA